MSDLDLDLDLDVDAMRAWWSNFNASVEAGINLLDPVFGAMALRDIRALLAEVERLRDINGKLALTIKACPEGHHDANLAHARAERDQLRAEVERLKANQTPDGGECTHAHCVDITIAADTHFTSLCNDCGATITGPLRGFGVGQ